MAAMNTLTKSQLAEIAKRGWSVSFTYGSDGWDAEHAFAGDSNCWHQKEYDPSDGHGFSSVEIPLDKYPDDDDDWTLDNAVALIYEQIIKVEPGASR